MSTAPALPVVRLAARVLLVDDRDRVLLFRGADPHVPDAPFWFTPGGGIDPGETVEEAARRELREETGCVDAPFGPAVWTRTAEFVFEGVAYRQRETFFLARIPSWQVDTGGFTELEQRTVHAHHWWTLDELRGTGELVYPTALASLLEELLRGALPATPVEVGL